MTDAAPHPESGAGPGEPRLDRALEFAFLPREEDGGASVVAAIERMHGVSSRVQLRGGGSAMPGLPDGVPTRFTIGPEIGRERGGVVYEGRDADLGRAVALKVLRSEYATDEDPLSRFLEGAQIEGQLQHPSIAPVYGLGLDPSNVPFIVLQRIEGETLADRLAGRDAPHRDRRHLLGIFERVCQAVAYAHARGVIHRDLDPRHVRIGSFGEVQVTDWGLARLLDRGNGRPGDRDDEVDERTDVFALGATLCEVLTGEPPRAGDLEEQLGAAEADEQLVDLALRCLSPDREARPPDGSVVAASVTEALARAERRAREAEVRAAEERARAAREREGEALERRGVERERRARVRTLAIGTVVVLTLLAAAVALFFTARAEQARVAETHDALTAAVQEATRLEADGRLAPSVAWAKRAVDIARAGEVDAASQVHTEQVLRRVETKERASIEAARRQTAEAALLERLEAHRVHRSLHDPEDRQALHAAYAREFREFGIDIEGLEVEDAAARLRQCVAPRDLATVLEDWSWIARPGDRLESIASDPRLWFKLIVIAQLTDPDEWRNRLRRAGRDLDLGALRAAAAEDLDLPPRSRLLLSRYLEEARDPRGAVGVLRRAYLHHPEDYWVNMRLSTSLLGLGEETEALAHLHAALALRPDDPCTMCDLSQRLRQAGDLAAAVALAEDSLRLPPEHGLHHVSLALALWERGDRAAALDAARRAVAVESAYAAGHLTLGSFLWKMGDLPAASEHYRRAAALRPDHAKTLREAAWFLATCAAEDCRDVEAAVSLAARAVERQPAVPGSWRVYGAALYRAESHAEAIGALTRGIELEPAGGGPRAWYWLAMAYHRADQGDQARAWFERAEHAVKGGERAHEDIPWLRAEAYAVLGLEAPK